MNGNIERLYRISNQPVRTIIGLMSGTSFDGLDIAVCEFTGSGLETRVKVTHFVTREYEPRFKEELKSIFAKKWADLEKVTLLHAQIGRYYGQLILSCLQEWQIDPGQVDLVASHGQTIYHAPQHQHGLPHYPNATLQIGDGDHIAVTTGIITFSDFRQKHIAAGGEGAPLAVYGDYLAFADPIENRVMLNIGGIANFTFLPAGQPGNIFSTDVGPGNTLMDQYIQAKFPGKYYDRDGALSRSGRVNEPLLSALYDHAFFNAAFPKTTGPELFDLPYVERAVAKSGAAISDADVMATLAALSAKAIITTINQCVRGLDTFEIYLSGGGMYNPVVVKYIEDYFGRKPRSTADLGIHPDAKEAVLFALLANEAITGGKTTFGKAGMPSVSMGKVSFPE
jgi:anhydro-N-acetylmuramic acid kinase